MQRANTLEQIQRLSSALEKKYPISATGYDDHGRPLDTPSAGGSAPVAQTPAPEASQTISPEEAQRLKNRMDNVLWHMWHLEEETFASARINTLLRQIRRANTPGEIQEVTSRFEASYPQSLTEYDDAGNPIIAQSGKDAPVISSSAPRDTPVTTQLKTDQQLQSEFKEKFSHIAEKFGALGYGKLPPPNEDVFDKGEKLLEIKNEVSEFKKEVLEYLDVLKRCRDNGLANTEQYDVVVKVLGFVENLEETHDAAKMKLQKDATKTPTPGSTLSTVPLETQSLNVLIEEYRKDKAEKAESPASVKKRMQRIVLMAQRHDELTPRQRHDWEDRLNDIDAADPHIHQLESELDKEFPHLLERFDAEGNRKPALPTRDVVNEGDDAYAKTWNDRLQRNGRMIIDGESKVSFGQPARSLSRRRAEKGGGKSAAASTPIANTGGLAGSRTRQPSLAIEASKETLVALMKECLDQKKMTSAEYYSMRQKLDAAHSLAQVQKIRADLEKKHLKKKDEKAAAAAAGSSTRNAQGNATTTGSGTTQPSPETDIKALYPDLSNHPPLKTPFNSTPRIRQHREPIEIPPPTPLYEQQGPAPSYEDVLLIGSDVDSVDDADAPVVPASPDLRPHPHGETQWETPSVSGDSMWGGSRLSDDDGAVDVRCTSANYGGEDEDEDVEMDE